MFEVSYRRGGYVRQGLGGELPCMGERVVCALLMFLRNSPKGLRAQQPWLAEGWCDMGIRHAFFVHCDLDSSTICARETFDGFALPDFTWATLAGHPCFLPRGHACWELRLAQRKLCDFVGCEGRGFMAWPHWGAKRVNEMCGLQLKMVWKQGPCDGQNSGSVWG